MCFLALGFYRWASILFVTEHFVITEAYGILNIIINYTVYLDILYCNTIFMLYRLSASFFFKQYFSFKFYQIGQMNHIKQS